MDCLKKCFTSLLLFLLAFTHFVQGQGYESIFGDSSTSWKFYSTKVNFQGVTEQRVYSNDTVNINNNSYKELKTNEGFSLYHLLREDTSSGKIWAYHKEEKTERLVMDLDIGSNDSFFLNYDNRHSGQIDTGWHRVDTIFHKDGRKHVLFQKKGEIKSRDRLEFIEGIGPNIGFLFKHGAGYQYLICCHKNQERVYFDSLLEYSRIDTMLNSCPEPGRWYNGIDDNQKDKPNQVITYPNPAEGQMHFRISNRVGSSLFILKIFNSKGMKVYNEQLQKTQFQISNPGSNHVYFYQLFTNDYTPIGSGKIVFEN